MYDGFMCQYDIFRIVEIIIVCLSSAVFDLVHDVVAIQSLC